MTESRTALCDLTRKIVRIYLRSPEVNLGAIFIVKSQSIDDNDEEEEDEVRNFKTCHQTVFSHSIWNSGSEFVKPIH